MAPGLLNYLGLGTTSSAAAPPDEERLAVRALPASWYTSQDMYELERRAIFSRKWLLITHKARFVQPGDFLRYDIAGYQVVLCRDRNDNINGFHNVCRHRAYPVVEKESGTAKIFACRYHGWSYGLNGKLAKAPQYQDMDNFEKDQNGLLRIHVRVDKTGFVWINMDSKDEPEVAWEDDFNGLDQQERFDAFNFDDYVFDHAWKMEGHYNWKILADNFNECYHCPTTHPTIDDLGDIDTLRTHTQACAIIHDSEGSKDKKETEAKIASTYCFPNASASVMRHFIMIQKFLPDGPKRSTMSYEIFRNKNSSEEEFQFINQLYKRIVSEDKQLCVGVQENLERGVLINGEMHPVKEKGPLYFQKVCRETVMEHHKREQAAKHQIWPARQTLPGKATVSQEDVDFCSGLACQINQEGLVW